MRVPQNILFILMLSITICRSVNAQMLKDDLKPTITQFSAPQGLEGDSVFDILEAKDGILWLATNAGLVKYDGYSFKLINLGIDPNNYKYREISAFRVIEGKDNSIWVEKPHFLFKYQPISETYIKYSIPFNYGSQNMIEDEKGSIWVVNENDVFKLTPTVIGDKDTLLLQNFQTEKIENKRQDSIPPSLTNYHVDSLAFKGITIDKNGGVWLIADRGLIRINSKQSPDKFFELIQRFPEETDSNYDIKAFAENGSGQIWILTKVIKGSKSTEAKLYLDLFNPNEKIFQNIHQSKWPFFQKNIWNQDKYRLVRDSINNGIWVSTFKVTSPNLHFWKYPFKTPPEKVEIYNKPFNLLIHDLVLDKNNNLWMGTQETGLFKNAVDLKDIKSFQLIAHPLIDLKRKINIYNFAETSDKRVYMGTFAHGMYRFNPFTEKIDNFLTPDTLRYNHTSNKLENRCHVFVDSKDRIWVGGNGNSIHLFNPDSETFTSFNLPDSKNISRYPNVHVLFEDKNGLLLINFLDENYNPLAYYFKPETNEFLEYEAINNNARLRPITYDKNGNLLVRGIFGGGTYVFHQKDSLVKQLASYVNWDLEWLDNGDLAIATDKEGLLIFDSNYSRKQQITTQKGLPSNSIRNIFKDKNNRLWLQTRAGFAVYNPTIDSISIPSSLAITEGINIAMGNSIIHSDGSFYVRSSKRDVFFWFHPDDIKKDLLPPKVYIEKMKIEGENLHHQFSNFKNQFSFNFNYDQNDLELQYIGLHYDNSQKINYRYQLNPIHKDWVNAGAERIARFPNLLPGTYTFKVKAANADGIWSEPKSLKITIHPPWWQTWWAYLVYSLLIIGLLYYWYRSLQQKLEKEQAHNQELIELNEANQRFVPNDFLQILGKKSIKDLKLGDQVATKMTVLFSDIRDYTPLSESMTPEQNFKFINAYLGRVGPIIKAHGGFISSYLGDGLMALFVNEPQNAVAATIAMQKELDNYNQERKAKGLRSLKTGMGLNTGDLMLGVIGDQHRYESTVISDAVNTASRMEGLTKVFGAAIILSERTIAAMEGNSCLPSGMAFRESSSLKPLSAKEEDSLKESPSTTFAYRYLGKVKVKGKDKALKIYDLYEGETVAIRQLKARTHDLFERGIHHYYQREFGKAAECFKQVLILNENDKAAQYYLDKSVGYIVNGVAADWSGVEEMVMK